MQMIGIPFGEYFFSLSPYPQMKISIRCVWLLKISNSIWDWTKNQRLNRFSNANPDGTRINEARFINEDDQAFLLTGSSDGIVRVFRNYESPENIELVSAFRGLTRRIASPRMAGLVLDWQQGQGKLLVAGDDRVIRVWSAAAEICLTVKKPFLFPPPQLTTQRLTVSSRKSPPAPPPRSRPSPPTPWPARSSSPATATAPSASSTSAPGRNRP